MRRRFDRFERRAEPIRYSIESCGGAAGAELSRLTSAHPKVGKFEDVSRRLEVVLAA
jgi:hypothetical protein